MLSESFAFRRLVFTGSPCPRDTVDVMHPPLLIVTCSDLHPGCGSRLWGRSAEDVVLAYVLHQRDEHVVAQVDLDDLLASITVCEPGSQGVPAGSVRPALSLVR